MTTETRTVTKYVADDGTVFDDIDSCEKYERTKTFITAGRDPDCPFIDWIDEVKYLVLANDTSVHYFTESCDYWGISTDDVDGSGYYYYDESLGKYKNIDNEIKRLTEIKQKLIDALKSVV